MYLLIDTLTGDALSGHLVKRKNKKKLSRLKDDKTESLYAGQTGRHPLQRYLQHLRKYKSGRGISNRLKYLKDFYSGYTTEQDSLDGEKVISKKLMNSYKVYGDGTK